MDVVHGQATIRLNGQVYESMDDASLTVGGIQNNVRMAGPKSFRNQTTIQSEVKAKFPLGNDMSMTDLQGMADVEITFESNTGRTWVIASAAQVGKLSIAGGTDGGTVEVEFHGDPAEEM